MYAMISKQSSVNGSMRNHVSIVRQYCYLTRLFPVSAQYLHRINSESSKSILSDIFCRYILKGILGKRVCRVWIELFLLMIGVGGRLL